MGFVESAGIRIADDCIFEKDAFIGGMNIRKLLRDVIDMKIKNWKREF